MILESWVETPLARAAGWALFHSLWEAAVVSAVLAAVLSLVRSARARYGAACLALCAVLVCFAATFLESLPRAHTQTASSNRILFTWANLADGGTGPSTPVRIADVLPWLAPFWMAGVLLLCLWHLASWIASRRLRRTGVCCAPEFWQERLRVLSARLRLAEPVALLESCLTRVPVVIGHVRPIILLPVGLLTGMPGEQIEAILLHELAHIRRFDYLVNMLQTAVESLLFYHPLVWWISHVIRAEREHCCDDLAAYLSGKHQYAEALAALEQSRWGIPETALAATGGNLVKRIRRLLIPRERPSSHLAPLVAAGILLLVGAAGLLAWQGTPAAQSQTQPQVSPYTKWLQEDVAYIITDEERAAYKRLQIDEERQHFIAQFWERRNPIPGSADNAFRKEHYRRIQYTNNHFTSMTVPGWKTDRGRIYIMFGPPDEIDEHPSGGTNKPYPYEIWHYRFIEGIGNDVYMEFLDPNKSGEYHMALDPNPSPADLRLVLPPPLPR
jgi:GWxTD domain-containing protein